MYSHFLKRFILVGLSGLLGLQVNAWELHTLLAQPLFSSMEEIVNADSIVVTTLEEFLLAVDQELARTLEAEEQWAQANLDFYSPTPEALTYFSGSSETDIRRKFVEAIRINPETKLIPYLQLLPGAELGSRKVLTPEQVNPLKENDGFFNVTFVALLPGEKIDPLSVLVAANHEPDLGMDIGLYENNNTEWGQRYGLGTQPFGNANLEYGSQAPIHMGLFHEAGIINRAAPFLRNCYPEYRIHLFKSLAEMAFRMDQDYWGWRFMGWGLHYLADMTQPYHARALPGVGTFKMITMNVMNMLGFSKMQENAVQLVSNRHMAIELFERQILEQAYLENDTQYRLFQTLRTSENIPEYGDRLPREVIAKQAYRQSERLDQVIAKNFPAQMVSNPTLELGDNPEKDHLLTVLGKSGNPQAIKNLEHELNQILMAFAMYGRSYTLSILKTLP